MKKLVVIFSLLFIAGFVFAQNLVIDPGFENWTSGVPDSWTLDDESGDCTFSQEVGGGVTGDAIKTTANINGSGFDGSVSQIVIGIVAGTNYDFSIKVKDNTDVIKCRWWCYWQDGTGTNIGSAFNQIYLNTNSPDWQLFETSTTTAPAGAVQVKFDIRIYFTGTPGGESILLDDASAAVGSGGIPISKAYSISSTSVDVLYNADLTSIDPADYTLTGSATITFSGATIDGSDSKLVHLTGASSSMVGDTTFDNIDDSANSTDYDFYAGIMPISNTNTNNPGGHIDNTHLATYQGIVSANDAYNNVWVSDSSGAYNGILIYDYDFDSVVAVEDEILFTATRDVYNYLTELKTPELLSIISSGNNPYGPDIILGSIINETLAADENPGESWEGQLVKIENVYVESYVDYDYRCTDDGGNTYFHVGDNVDYHFGAVSLNVGSTYSEIVGVVDWHNSSDNYRINPRDAGDIGLLAPTDLTVSVSGNDVVLNWTVVSGATGYNIYRSTDPYNFGSTVHGFAMTNSFTDTGAASGDKYFYRVTATN